jgi:hypothetical protein
MNYTLITILGFSIIIPAIIAFFRIGSVDVIYLPFIICIWIGVLNEVMNFIMPNIFHISNSINTDIYCFIEAFLYLWLFYNFNIFKSKGYYVLIVTIFFVVWIVDNFLIEKVSQFDSYFTILYSLTIVFMSITIINRLIMSNADLLKNSIFLLCIAFVIYFSVMAFVEVFWLYGINASKAFRLNIYRIMAYINLFVNLLFAIAILWMHRKQEFMPQQ